MSGTHFLIRYSYLITATLVLIPLSKNGPRVHRVLTIAMTGKLPNMDNEMLVESFDINQTTTSSDAE